MKNLAKAVIAVMKAVKGMEKNSKVGTGGSAYNGTKYSDVAEVFNDAMSLNGLCILPLDIDDSLTLDRWEEADPWSKPIAGQMKTKQSVFTTVKTKYLLLHESGESIELAGYGHGVDPQDKGAGKATTYALKNCLLYTFLTPVGKIDDTDTTHSDDIKVPSKTPKNAAYKTDAEFEKIVEWVKKAPLETNARIGVTLEKAKLTDAQKKRLEALRIVTDEEFEKIVEWVYKNNDDMKNRVKYALENYTLTDSQKAQLNLGITLDDTFNDR